MDADPPNILGRPQRDRDVTDLPIPTHRGNGDSMSGRYLEQRGRPVPDAGSRPATALFVLVRAGVGEGHITCDAGQCRRREGPLLLVCF